LDVSERVRHTMGGRQTRKDLEGELGNGLTQARAGDWFWTPKRGNEKNTAAVSTKRNFRTVIEGGKDYQSVTFNRTYGEEKYTIAKEEIVKKKVRKKKERDTKLSLGAGD